jgi:hypothetical protein
MVLRCFQPTANKMIIQIAKRNNPKFIGRFISALSISRTLASTSLHSEAVRRMCYFQLLVSRQSGKITYQDSTCSVPVFPSG